VAEQPESGGVPSDFDKIRTQFIPFLSRIVTIQMHGTTSDQHRISGRVEEIGPVFLCLVHKGEERFSLVKMEDIAVISVVPDRRLTGNIEK
jgi:hypothetical protein